MSYKCFLYRKVSGRVESCLFYTVEDAEKALKSGEWKDTPAVFVNTVEEIPLAQRETVKKVAVEMATDFNILANADKIDDIDRLKEIYKRVSGKDMHKRVKTIEGARKAIEKLLGVDDGNGSDIH